LRLAFVAVGLCRYSKFIAGDIVVGWGAAGVVFAELSAERDEELVGIIFVEHPKSVSRSRERRRRCSIALIMLDEMQIEM